MTTASDVLAGRARFAVECADVLTWLPTLPDDSIDLLFTSPPYRLARTYGIDAGRDTDEWVSWMLAVVKAAAPKVRGLIAINCDGQTEDYRYQPCPYLLMADLHRAGFNLRRPVVYHRVGIPGSGGPDWLRADTEPVICITRPGRLPFSDNTACGHPPKWAPGGEMSHRTADGQRVNQWGMRVRKDGDLTATSRGNDGGGDGLKRRQQKPSHVVAVGTPPDDTPGLFDVGERVEVEVNSYGMTGKGPESRLPSGKRRAPSPSSQKSITVRRAPLAGDVMEDQSYAPPVLANPGNLVQERYSADEVAALLAQAGDVTHHTVGGGQMGHALAHDNEAPFPVTLATFFVLSFCPEGGVVCDPFTGSGSTGHAALDHGRRFIGCDIRPGKGGCKTARARLETVTPSLLHTVTDD